MRFSLILVAAVGLMAEEVKEAPKPPVIPADQLVAYFQADSDLAKAQLAMSNITSAIFQTCGGKEFTTLNQVTKRPECLPKSITGVSVTGVTKADK